MYDLSQLSPADFEDFSRDLLAANFGHHIESFGPGADQGIDARFAGKAGATIIQAKHYLKSGRSALVSALKDEAKKLKKLAPARYILVTSVSLNPAWKSKIIDALDLPSQDPADILGQEDLNALLRGQPEVEKSHYKLWLSSSAVLDRIVHNEIYNRTDIELDLIEEMVPKFVQNDSVLAAEKILKDRGSLIISGHPGVGKTTLARMLAWLHAAQDWDVFVIDDIADAYKVPNSGKKRLVLFDDFLGQVRLSADLVRGLDSKLPPFLTKAKNDKALRFVLTTRQYILSQAWQMSSRLADSSNLNHYILNVGVYTRSIKARILYNHVYFSSLSKPHVSALLDDRFYLTIIDHANFNPRLIDLLTSEAYAQLTEGDIRASILHILDNPQALWERPFREHLSDDARVILVAMLLFGRNAGMESLRANFSRTAKAMDVEVPPANASYRFNKALKELEGSALYIVNDAVQYSNPGVRDYVQSVVIADGLTSSLIEAAETFREVSALWQLLEPQRDMKELGEASRLFNALTRDRVAETTPTLDGLKIGLEMYAYFGDHKFLEFVYLQSDSLLCQNPDPSEGDTLTDLLRRISAAFGGGEEGYRVIESVCDAICYLLENHAEEMPFDDVEALDSALVIYSHDRERGASATRAAISRIIEDIETGVDEYGSVEDLDYFEERLIGLASAREYKERIPKEEISERREYLEFKAAESYDDYERPSAGVSASSPDSDSAIASMFEGLR